MAAGHARHQAVLSKVVVDVVVVVPVVLGKTVAVDAGKLHCLLAFYFSVAVLVNLRENRVNNFETQFALRSICLEK